MNILPKKSWHVRTNKNIERVKRDEAQAAEENKKKQERAALADQEARTALLRSRARQLTSTAQDNNDGCLTVQNVQDQDIAPTHVNLFSEQDDEKSKGKTNKEHEKEEKAAQEKYEKSIGLLTYLGQSSAEAQTTKPWYFKPPRASTEGEHSVLDMKRKASLDPMVEMERYLGTKRPKVDATKPTPRPVQKQHSTALHNVTQMDRTLVSKRESLMSERTTHKSKHKHKQKRVEEGHQGKKRKEKKKHRHKEEKISRSDDDRGRPSIEQLREARIKREAGERIRTNRLLSGHQKPDSKGPEEVTDLPGRYNSQFHPELVRQRPKPFNHGKT